MALRSSVSDPQREEGIVVPTYIGFDEVHLVRRRGRESLVFVYAAYRTKDARDTGRDPIGPPITIALTTSRQYGVPPLDENGNATGPPPLVRESYADFRAAHPDLVAAVEALGYTYGKSQPELAGAEDA
jgi:hypothetical protein